MQNGFHYTTKPGMGAQLDRSHPASVGLVNFWLMNENTGLNSYDIAGQNHFTGSGTIIRTAMSDGPGIGTGTSGLLQSGSSPLSGVSQFTVIFREKIATGSFPALFGTNTAYNGSIYAYLDPPGLSLFVGGSKIFDKSGTLTPGLSYHIAFTFSGSGLQNQSRYYSNGALASTNTALSNASVPTHSYIRVGQDGGGASQSNGTRSWMKIYNRVLSAAEIQADYEFPYAMIAPPTVRRFLPSIGGVITNALAGAFSSTSGLSANLSVSAPIISSFNALSSLASSFSISAPVAGGVSGLSAVTGLATISPNLASALTIQSSILGNSNVVIPLTVTLPVTSALAGAIASNIPLASTMPAVLATTGNLTVGSALSVFLQGSVNDTASFTGALLVTPQLASILASTEGQTATLTLGDPLSGVVGASGMFTGTLTIGGLITSNVLYYFTKGVSGRSVVQG